MDINKQNVNKQIKSNIESTMYEKFRGCELYLSLEIYFELIKWLLLLFLISCLFFLFK